jgi:hypothetical protein
MIYFLSLLFAMSCLIVAMKIVQEFKDGFDWFSGTLYFIIFLVCCGLLYVLISRSVFRIKTL